MTWVVIGLLIIWNISDNIEIYSMRVDIQGLNRIVKTLQARNGIKADGIDKTG